MTAAQITSVNSAPSLSPKPSCTTSPSQNCPVMTARIFLLALLLLVVGACITAVYSDPHFSVRQDDSPAPEDAPSPRLEINTGNMDTHGEPLPNHTPTLQPTPSPSNGPMHTTNPEPTSDPTPETTPTSTPTATPTPTSIPPTENFLLADSTVGYLRLVGAGVTVTRGVVARLNFELTVSAHLSNVLASNDESFKETLVGDEVEEYEKLSKEYDGGLDVPFLQFLGANLATNVTREEQEEVSMRRSNYAKNARAARTILLGQHGRATISGEKTITGTSFIPTTYFAYIKAANGRLSDGSKVLVVSTSPDDVSIATTNGVVLVKGADSFNVVEESASDDSV